MACFDCQGVRVQHLCVRICHRLPLHRNIHWIDEWQLPGTGRWSRSERIRLFMHCFFCTKCPRIHLPSRSTSMLLKLLACWSQMANLQPFTHLVSTQLQHQVSIFLVMRLQITYFVYDCRPESGVRELFQLWTSALCRLLVLGAQVVVILYPTLFTHILLLVRIQGPTDAIANLYGTGTTIFDSCTFVQWDLGLLCSCIVRAVTQYSSWLCCSLQ